MGVTLFLHNASPIKKTRPATLGATYSEAVTNSTSNTTLSQLDGSSDYPQQKMPGLAWDGHAQRTPPGSRQQQHQHTNPRQQLSYIQAPSGQANQAPRNVVNELLPYCTMEPPLSEAQTIALSDVAGNLKELALLALGAAAGDFGCVEGIEGAVGAQAASNITGFFMDEWEIEG